MTSDYPITRSPDVPISAGISPLDVWIAIKTVLRRELGEREWEMWIQHARLWRVLSGDTLGVLVPRNGKASFGILRHIKRVRRLAAKMAYGVMVTVAHDPDYQQIRREAIIAMDRGEDFPACHAEACERLKQWEEENEWLNEPFLEPPCSPLWSNQ